MKRLLLLTIYISIFFISSNVFSGVLIEPYVGYTVNGDGELKLLTTSYDQSYSGLTYGGRLGYNFLGLMTGLDYSMQSIDLKSNVMGNTFSASDSVDKTQLGAFLGYEFPIMLRAWGTYFFNAEFRGADDAKLLNQLYAKRDVVEDGSGYALGLGFTGLPFMSINLEYRTFEYDKIISAGQLVTFVTSKQKLSELLLSISLPIDL